jgi:hypothetical protein
MANSSWKADQSGTLTDAANWTAGVPGTADYATFATGGATPYSVAGDLTIGDLILQGDTVTLTGSLTTTGIFQSFLGNTQNAQIDGDLTVAAGAFLTGEGDSIEVGQASAGSLLVQGVVSSGDMVIGYGARSTVTVDGNGATLSSVFGAQVDEGALIIQNHGSVAGAIALGPGTTLELDDTTGQASTIQSLAGTIEAVDQPGQSSPGTVNVSGRVDLATGPGFPPTTLAGTAQTTLSIAGQITQFGPGPALIIDGGTVRLSNAGNSLPAGIELAAGTLDLAVPGAAGGSGGITFATSDPTLQIDGTVMPSNTITDFIAGDTIDLTGISFAAGDSVSYSGTTLDIVDAGTTLAALTLTGKPYTSSDFFLSKDAGTGTDITTNMPCFAAGARVATERGDVAVEALRVGDRVRTVSGALRPIAWIGQREVDCRHHPRPEHVWPVRVLAHAFGPGLPARDLLLSPDHSLYIDGVLIPVQHLVNGTVIVQEPRERIHYFHVELPRHDVLLAEGLPAETYLDTGNRHAFANGAAHMMLHPEFEPLDWYDDACAPLCQRGPKLTAARRALFAEAERRGWRVVGSTDLQVEIGERSLSAARVKGKLHQFLLPSGTRELRIVSHPGVPAELDPGVDDRRRLGARIGAVFVDGKVLPLDDAALAAGFHPPERSGGECWRWTDGAALLRLPAPLSRAAVLELLVRDTMRHWQHPEHRIAAAG